MMDYLISAGKWILLILAVLFGILGGGAICLVSIAFFVAHPAIFPFLTFCVGIVIVGLAIPGVGKLCEWVIN